MHECLGSQNRYRLFLLGISAIALVLISLSTSKYGAGVSSDAARNLSTADNLVADKGFVDMTGAPFVLWPPLYPLLLAGISLLTRWSVFQSAWYLNLLLYPVNIGLAGWLLYRIFEGRAIYAVAGSLVVLLSRSMLRIHANVASEPLFETLILLFCLGAPTYLRTSSPGKLWLLCFLAALAALQRYPGVVLSGLTLGLVLYRSGIRGVARAAPQLLAAIVPLGSWALFHNLQVSGTLFGPRQLGAMLPIQNITLTLTKIAWWFLPRYGVLDWLVLHPWVLVIGSLGALLLVNRGPTLRAWTRALRGAYIWPGLLFSAVYFLLLAFTVVTADHLDLTSDRYYVVLLPFVVALVLLTLDSLVMSHLHLQPQHLQLALIGVMLVWGLYPLYSLRQYVQQALVQGEPTNYNIANSAHFREMSVVEAAGGILAKDPNALVYSNYLNIVWFIFHHPVAELPFEDAALPREQRLAALKQNYADWPSRPGYIVWFTPNQYHHIAAPDELKTIANLQLLFDDDTGQIYSVTP
jgi:hypothetical protein